MTFGVYIHIPFCDTRCNYCHFVTQPWKPDVAERYCRALILELREFFSTCPCVGEADTIYFGGGTPSIMRAELISGILDACRGIFPVSADCEITLEANPGSLTQEKASVYKSSGINRISLGAQSFDNLQLRAIGRDHTADQVDESFNLLRTNGIRVLNMDLLLGLPGQTRQQWQVDLGRCVRLKPEHLSIYMLDLDERSPLFHQHAKGRCTLPEDDLVTDLYLHTIDYLAENCYEQYEVSNFALPGHMSRHNLKYWKLQPVLGFGVGSHSFDGQARFANFSNTSNYLAAVEAGRLPTEWRETLQEIPRLQETIFLGLRLNSGLDWSTIRREHRGVPQVEKFESILRDLSHAGLLEWQDAVVRLTSSGRLLSNEVFREFV